MKRGRLHWMLLGGLAVLLITAAAAAPYALRHVDSFRVRRIEVTGNSYLTARRALAASGVTQRANVFDDFGPARARLERDPLVLDARIERLLPGTLIFHIREAVPIALARTPELVAVDARGQLLPIDLATTTLDLPVLDMTTRADVDGRIGDPVTLGLLRTLSAIRQSQPWLAAWISEAGPLGSDGVRLVLRWPGQTEILVPVEPDARRLHELRMTMANLAAPPDGGMDTDSSSAVAAFAHVARIDARFRDQVVVSFENREAS